MPTAVTTPRPPAYTKPTRTARHQHARAASPPSVRRSTAHPRANVLVRATILRVPPPTFAPTTSLASRTPAPLLSPLHTRHTCLSGIYECLPSDSSCSTTSRFEVRAGRGRCAFHLPEVRSAAWRRSYPPSRPRCRWTSTESRGQASFVLHVGLAARPLRRAPP